MIQVAATILLLYGLSSKTGMLLVLIPRPVVGAVFLVMCGMIATAGLRLLAALTLPLAAGGRKEWLESLSPTARLFLSHGVAIAITLGIVLNAALRAALGREAESSYRAGRRPEIVLRASSRSGATPWACSPGSP